MPPVYLRVASPTDGSTRTVPLAFGADSTCEIHLRCLPGAPDLHLVFLSEGGDVLWRGEIADVADEKVTVQVHSLAGDRFYVASPPYSVFTLPLNGRYDAAPPLPPVRPDAEVDLGLVIDGTTLWSDGKTEQALLSHKEAWGKERETLCAFAAALTEGTSTSRVAVLGFGDRDPTGEVERGLKPDYHVFPVKEVPRFEPFNRDRVRSRLAVIPATTGADFVDALADALHAAAGLPWRKEARRVLLVYGDSPGFSILHPLPKGADAWPRAFDVESEALRLHRAGVEIVTLYRQPHPERPYIDFARTLLEAARQQYARLASLPSLAFVTDAFDPLAAAKALRERSTAIGRQASLGEWLES